MKKLLTSLVIVVCITFYFSAGYALETDKCVQITDGVKTIWFSGKLSKSGDTNVITINSWLGQETESADKGFYTYHCGKYEKKTWPKGNYVVVTDGAVPAKMTATANDHWASVIIPHKDHKFPSVGKDDIGNAILKKDGSKAQICIRLEDATGKHPLWFTGELHSSTSKNFVASIVATGYLGQSNVQGSDEFFTNRCPGTLEDLTTPMNVYGDYAVSIEFSDGIHYGIGVINDDYNSTYVVIEDKPAPSTTSETTTIPALYDIGIEYMNRP